jgi:hypothetical protein
VHARAKYGAGQQSNQHSTDFGAHHRAKHQAAAEAIMNPFNKLPGFVRSAPGLEQRIWRRLPTIWLWGTLLPLLLAVLNHALSPADRSEAALLLWDYMMWGVVALHWTLLITLAVGCFIVRVMKGPAYVADAYPPPERTDRTRS